MFFQKRGKEYVFDKKLTEKIYQEMQEFKNNLYKKQQEVLKNMRKEGAIYEVVCLQDDCENWRTELKNISTNEVFQELELPHDVYHQLCGDSLLKYENGEYKILKGTSLFDRYPNNENYCQIKSEHVKRDNSVIYKEPNIFSKAYDFIKNVVVNVVHNLKEKINKNFLLIH